jgi:glycosyltransferase involved in cell wall biosynthesis
VTQFTSILQRFKQNVDPSEDSADLLRDADAARDGKDWGKAAGLYKEYLALSPDHCAIWVQMGHCLKEDKNVGFAIEAYKHALTLDPGDFDIYLNLGHAYKVAGDFAQAYQSYRKALELNPACEDASRDIAHLLSTGLVGGLSPEVGASGRTFYLDIADLMEYAKHNSTLSGIQRVVANLVLDAKRYEAATGINIVPVLPGYEPVFPEYDLTKLNSELLKTRAVDRVVVASLIAAILSGGKSRDEIAEAVRAVYATQRIVEPQSGDDFVMAGAFWIYPTYDAIKTMRANGVRFTLFIHDLIQISHPQYVNIGANTRFRHALVDALMLVDLVITNSEYVANDVRRFISSRLNFSLPVKAMPLATQLAERSQVARTAPPMRRDVQSAIATPFVLSVSTIEIRKNHMYMIRVWEELIANGVRNIPNLVFVGKLGWDIEPLLKYIAESDQLGGRLHILSNVSDRALTYLYEKCMFTMFPSFVEGFGLPVGESLAHGKPCIASNRSSMPEVGGSLVKYVSPEDVEGGARLVQELLADPAALSAWEKTIRESYKPRTWREFTTGFYDSILEQKNSPPCFSNLVCDPGEIYSFGVSALAERDARKQRLIYCAPAVDGNWHFAEGWGIWMAKRRASMLFRTRYAPGDVVAVYLELQLPKDMPPSSVKFSILSDGEPVDLCYFERERQWFVFEVAVGELSEVEIELVAMGEFKQLDSRQIFMGARRLCCCKADDCAARIRVIEKLTFLTNGHAFAQAENDGLKNIGERH